MLISNTRSLYATTRRNFKKINLNAKVAARKGLMAFARTRHDIKSLQQPSFSSSTNTTQFSIFTSNYLFFELISNLFSLTDKKKSAFSIVQLFLFAIL